jgi:AcrR family transcriptional regulator
VIGEASCSPPGLRARKKARTHEAIVDAALDLFERQGFEDTTIEDIAAAADVSPRTFFRYFESKVDVLMTTNKAEDEGFEDLVAAVPSPKGPLDATVQVIRERLEALAGDEDARALREFRVVMSTPSLRAIALDHFHDHQDGLIKVYAAQLGVDEHALKPRILAGAVATTMWAVVDQWVAEGSDPERLVPLIDEAFEMLRVGLD